MTSGPPPRVAVVGAGVVGLAVAYRLAERGCEVEVFERGEPGGATTHVAAGMLAPVSEADPAEPELLALGLQSAALWPAFAAELDEARMRTDPVDLELGSEPLLREDGTLLVARDADEARWLDREAGLRERAGLACERLTPTQARRLEPDLAPGLRGALLVPGDRCVDPRAVAHALRGALDQLGVAVVAEAAITGLDDPRLRGFDRIVVCTGAWPIEGVAEPARTHPVKGQLLMLRDPDAASRTDPILRRVLRAQTVYVVPRGDGRYVVGATMEHRGYDRTVTAWAVHDLLRELFEVLPPAREFAIDETAAGLRPATASGDPLIGPAPGDPAGEAARVLYAVGHYRNGVLLAPVTAQRIADLVAPPR